MYDELYALLIEFRDTVESSRLHMDLVLEDTKALKAAVDVHQSLVEGHVWRLSVRGQSAQPNPGGTFLVPSVVAPDRFGEEGPGSAPDFLSDDPVAMVGIAELPGGNHFLYTNSFRLPVGVYEVEVIHYSDSPPPFPDSITLIGDAVLAVGESIPLTVQGTLFGNVLEELTPTSKGTTYRVSNPNILTVNAAGLATGHAPGRAFVTASNNGVTAVRDIIVSSEVITTTVQGFLWDADGAPITGARVIATVFDGEAFTDANGFFSLVVSLPGDVTEVILVISMEGQGAFEHGPLAVVSNGITDAGIATWPARGEYAQPWQPNGAVHAIVTAEDALYIGGEFTYIGPRTGSFAAIDTATAKGLERFPLIDGLVRCAAPDGIGGWYVGGQFSIAGDAPRQNAAHFDAQ